MRHQSHIYPHRRKHRGTQWRQHKHREQIVHGQRHANHTLHLIDQGIREHGPILHGALGRGDLQEGDRLMPHWGNQRDHELYLNDEDGSFYDRNRQHYAWEYEHRYDYDHELQSQLECQILQSFPQHEAFVTRENAHTSLSQRLHKMRDILSCKDKDIAWDALHRLLIGTPDQEDQAVLLQYATPHVQEWHPKHCALEKVVPNHTGWSLVRTLTLASAQEITALLLSPPPQLHTLILAFDDNQNPASLRTLLDKLPQLRSLQITLSSNDDLAIWQQASQLETLAITWRQPTDGTLPAAGTTEENALCQLTQLAQVKALHHLSLNASMFTDLSPLYQVTSLRSLALHNCPPQMNLTHLHGLPRLTRLVCTHLDSIEGISALQNLEHLELCVSTETAGVDELSDLHQLRTLRLQGTLQDLNGLSLPKGLQELDLQGMHRLERIDKTLDLPKLKIILLTNLPNLVDIAGLIGLSSLRNISLAGCYQIASIESLQCSPYLEDIDVNNCFDLNHIDIFQTPELASNVQISSAKHLRPGAAVKQLRLRHADIPDISGIQVCSSLVELDLDWTGSQPKGLEILATLPALRKLNFNNWQQVEEVGHLPNITTLTITDGGGRQDLALLENYPSLVSLSLNHASQLTDISALRCLPQLREVTITKADGLSDVKPLQGLALRWLSLRDCAGIEDFDVHLPALVHLCLEGCMNLVTSPRLHKLPHLRSLNLYDCFRLQYLPTPQEATHLTSLALPETSVGGRALKQYTASNPQEIQGILKKIHGEKVQTKLELSRFLRQMTPLVPLE